MNVSQPELSAGVKAPLFTAHDTDGNKWALKNFLSKQGGASRFLLLFFLPNYKDATVMQCDEFSKLSRKFRAASTELVAISPSDGSDSPSDYTEFVQQMKPKFTMLIDKDHKLSALYGIWKERRMFNTTYWGTVRTTFLIDAKKGLLLKKFKVKKVEGHAEQVLNYITTISAEEEQHFDELRLGEKVPAFSALESSGARWKLREHEGRETLLCFFPSFETDAAQTQAIELATIYTDFQNIGVDVVCIVSASQNSASLAMKSDDKTVDGEGNVLTQTMLHELEIWKKKHSMNFPVLYDENHKVASRLGLWKEMLVFGNKSCGVERVCYYLDGRHVVRKVFNVGKVEGHAKQLFQSIADLKEKMEPAESADLQAGDKAPLFTAKATTDDIIKLKSYKGQCVVLLFRSSLKTDGFKAEYKELLAAPLLRKQGIQVLIITNQPSRDTLAFPVVVDGDFTIAHAYGVRKALVSFGEKTFGNQKKTFLLNGDGIITHVLFRSGKSGSHTAQIIQALTPSPSSTATTPKGRKLTINNRNDANGGTPRRRASRMQHWKDKAKEEEEEEEDLHEVGWKGSEDKDDEWGPTLEQLAEQDEEESELEDITEEELEDIAAPSSESLSFVVNVGEKRKQAGSSPQQTQKATAAKNKRPRLSEKQDGEEEAPRWCSLF
ncbi:hypothetical protein QOT17_021783 [Balamuthia mandrillaris]